MAIVVDSNPVPLETMDDGVLRIAGTRVTLDTIIAAFNRGESPEAIAEQYPTVALANLYSVIAFYLRRRAEVDDYLAARAIQREESRRLSQEQWPQDGIRDRLLQRQTPQT